MEDNKLFNNAKKEDLFKLKINHDGEWKEHPVLIGYSEQKGRVFNLLTISDNVDILYRIEKNFVQWKGELKPKLRDRLENAKDGELVTYNNKEFFKMSLSEIEKICEKEYFFKIN